MVDETEYITLKAGTIHHAGGCSVKVVEDFGGGGVALSSTRPPQVCRICDRPGNLFLLSGVNVLVDKKIRSLCSARGKRTRTRSMHSPAGHLAGLQAGLRTGLWF